MGRLISSFWELLHPGFVPQSKHHFGFPSFLIQESGCVLAMHCNVIFSPWLTEIGYGENVKSITQVILSQIFITGYE